MKKLTLISALIVTAIAANAQNVCAISFKRNNGNGTCGAKGELRITFPGGCLASVPSIDSVIINFAKYNVTFAAPNTSRCGDSTGYVSYCVLSGNMPTVDVWKIFFRNPDGTTYSCTVLDSKINLLPVKLTSFNASAVNGNVYCKWTTEQENNNHHFDLQRSSDGKNFTTIATITGKSGNGPKAYEFTDLDALTATNATFYYRLKQTDSEGGFTYLETVSVKVSPNRNIFSISPNPFAEKLTVTFDAMENGKVEVAILSVTGQMISSEHLIVTKGVAKVSVNHLSGLNKGIYVARVTLNNTLVVTKKVMKIQ